MPKRAAKKTGGTKNPDRRNGKAFARKQFDDKGRALTGRGKPSGHSVKGMKLSPDVIYDGAWSVSPASA